MKNNGWIKLHRKILDSELWLMKPCSWKVIWIYILGNVNHEPRSSFGRGEGFFQFSKELERIGPDVTIDMVKKFLNYARENRMLDTKRSTRGVRLKVLNYNTYQDLESETSTDQSTNQAPEKHQRSTPIHKNVRMEEGKKNTSDETSHGVSPPFIFQEYVKKLEDSPRRDLNIIALYLEERKPQILSAEQMRVAVRRHLRPAKDLVPFTNHQILDAIPRARKATENWTLETLVKVLTK